MFKQPLIVFTIALTALLANSPYQSLQAQTSRENNMPKVFVLGDNEKGYEQLVGAYGMPLLTACNNDMQRGFELWLSMMQEMEAYSKQINFDLDGIKVWLHVFWDKDGTVNHIAYHLRPNSRNVKTEELTAFFVSFTNHYKFPLTAVDKFSHYTGASFPTFSKRVDD